MKRTPNNLYDYVHWRGDLSFEERPFNEIDAAILSMLVYMDWYNIVGDLNSNQTILLRDACTQYDKRYEKYLKHAPPLTSFDEETRLLAHFCQKTKRFGLLKMRYFEERTDLKAGEQFAAITFETSCFDPAFVVVYRGTDNQWIGWKEDFELTYKLSVPAQISADEYMYRVLNKLNGKFIVTGHSKGGNLTAYAVARISEEIRSKSLIKAYGIDPLGFDFDLVDRRIYDRCAPYMLNLVPQDALVTAMSKPVGAVKVVRSESSGFNQHMPFLWHLDPKGFINSERSELSYIAEEIMQTWIQGISLDEREVLFETVFELFGASEGAWRPKDAKQTLELWRKIEKNKPKLSDRKQDFINQQISKFNEIAFSTIAEKIRQRLPWSADHPSITD